MFESWYFARTWDKVSEAPLEFSLSSEHRYAASMALDQWIACNSLTWVVEASGSSSKSEPQDGDTARRDIPGQYGLTIIAVPRSAGRANSYCAVLP